MKKTMCFVAMLSLMFSMPVFAEPEVQTSEGKKGLSGTGFWVMGLAGQGNQTENKSYKAYQDNMMDYTVGFDSLANSHVRLGGTAGYGFSDKNFKQNRTGFGSYGIDDNAFEVTATATYDSINLCESRKNGKYSPEAVRNQGINGWYVDSALGFTQHNYDLRTERFNFALAPNMEVGKSDYHGQEYTLGTEAGYIFNFGEEKTVHVTPFTSLDWGYLYRNLSKVKGLGANDYKVKGEGSNDLEQGFGVQLAKSFVSEKLGTFIPFVRPEWDIAYVRDIQSHNRQRNSGRFGAGMIFLNKGHMTWTAGWDMLVQNRYLENVGYGKIRYDF